MPSAAKTRDQMSRILRKQMLHAAINSPADAGGALDAKAQVLPDYFEIDVFGMSNSHTCPEGYGFIGLVDGS